jgi:DNA-binding NarL/FixJ family response regulator
MTPEQLETVLSMARQGLPFRYIAEQVGFSDAAISRAAIRAGYYRQPRPKIPVTAIIRAYETGMNATQIASKLKASRTTVIKYLRVYGCKIRLGGYQPKVPPERIYSLRMKHGLPWTEIAKRLGLKDTTVRTRFLRYQRRLQRSAEYNQPEKTKP